MFVKKKETKQQVIEVKKIVEKTGPTYHTNSVALEWMEEDSSRPFAHTHHENERRTDAAKAISATALFSHFFVFHFGDTSTKTFCDDKFPVCSDDDDGMVCPLFLSCSPVE